MKAGFCVAKIIRGFYMPRPFNAQAKTRSLLGPEENAGELMKGEREKEIEREESTATGVG